MTFLSIITIFSKNLFLTKQWVFTNFITINIKLPEQNSYKMEIKTRVEEQAKQTAKFNKNLENKSVSCQCTVIK